MALEDLFFVHGGQRIKGVADGGPVQVTAADMLPNTANILVLNLAPVGDYSIRLERGGESYNKEVGILRDHWFE